MTQENNDRNEHSNAQQSASPDNAEKFTKKKDGWDKVEIIAKIIGNILIPIVIALFSILVTRSIHTKE